MTDKEFVQTIFPDCNCHEKYYGFSLATFSVSFNGISFSDDDYCYSEEAAWRSAKLNISHRLYDNYINKIVAYTS